MLRSLASRFLKLPRPLQAVPVVVVAAALWWAWPVDSLSDKGAQAGPAGPGGPGGPRGPVPVRVAQVVQADFAVYEKALGTVTALNTVNVRARVGGELVKVLFEEGQMVKAGQLLAQIDPRPYEVAVQQAEGTLLQNQAQLKNAEIDLARYRGLYVEQSIAKQTLDTQQALVGQYQGTLKSNQATLAEARLNLQFSQIKAPISGRVGLRQLDAGNLLAANDSTVLAVITQTQPIAVAFTLPEGQVPALRAAQRSGAQLLVEAWDRNEQHLLASGTLCWAIGWLSWRLIERPALALRRHWLSRPAPAPSTQAPAPAAPPLDRATSAVVRGRADAARRRGFRAPARPSWAILPRARPARSR